MPAKKKPDTKNQDINKLFMEQVGIDITSDGHLIDQDTFNQITIKQKDTVLKGYKNTNTNKVIEIDPATNSKHAKDIFDYYNNKIEEEDGIKSFSMYNTYDTDVNKGKVVIECKKSDSTGIVRSDEYTNESLCYLDLIYQMNGYDTNELHKLDRTKEEFEKIRRAEERARKAEEKKRLEARKPKYEIGSEEQRQAQLRAIRRKLGQK